MSGVSLRGAEVYHCPFCGLEDLQPAAEPAGAWSCRSCARVFTVSLVRVAEERIPGRIAASAKEATE